MVRISLFTITIVITVAIIAIDRVGGVRRAGAPAPELSPCRLLGCAVLVAEEAAGGGAEYGREGRARVGAQGDDYGGGAYDDYNAQEAVHLCLG